MFEFHARRGQLSLAPVIERLRNLRLKFALGILKRQTKPVKLDYLFTQSRIHLEEVANFVVKRTIPHLLLEKTDSQGDAALLELGCLLEMRSEEFGTNFRIFVDGQSLIIRVLDLQQTELAISALDAEPIDQLYVELVNGRPHRSMLGRIVSRFSKAIGFRL